MKHAVFIHPALHIPRALELALADWIRLALSDTETH